MTQTLNPSNLEHDLAAGKEKDDEPQRHTEAQIIATLKQVEADRTAEDVAREQASVSTSNNEIGRKLFISLATVRSYAYSIFPKTGVKNWV